MRITKSYLKDLVYQVNGAAIEVHRELGPGLLESVYHRCMEHELKNRGVKFVSEMPVPVDFKGLKVQTNLRCDFFVENILPVELKAVDKVQPIHEAKLYTYMKLLKGLCALTNMYVIKGMMIKMEMTKTLSAFLCFSGTSPVHPIKKESLLMNDGLMLVK